MKIKDIIVLLMEKKTKKSLKNKIKLYTPELMIRKKETGAEYEVSEVDMTDQDNPILTVFRYDVNGSKKEHEVHTFKEIENKFEIA